MAWSTPRTWVAAETVTASIGNTHWRDNLQFLKDQSDKQIYCLYASTTAFGNVGSGEDDLITYSMPGATLAVNLQAVRIRTWGTYADNGNAKKVRLYFGAMVVSEDDGSASNNGTWVAEAVVIRTGAATQTSSGVMAYRHGGLGQYPVASVKSPTETLSGAITLKTTGAATSDNDIVCSCLMVELMRFA
jgi:hypothetical protein